MVRMPSSLQGLPVVAVGIAFAAQEAKEVPHTERDEKLDFIMTEREVIELKRANEILKKASAYFAQAELDRRGK